MAVRHLLSFLFVCLSGCFLLVWAGARSPALDFLGWGAYAASFPLGAYWGPLLATFGALLAAWLVFPPMVYAYVVKEPPRRPHRLYRTTSAPRRRLGSRDRHLFL